MLLSLFSFLFLLSIINSKIIKNINIPNCKNCIYYKPLLKNSLSEFDQCKYFSTKNFTTNDIIYDYADSCRKDELKCGLDGEYFIDKKDNNLLSIIIIYSIIFLLILKELSIFTISIFGVFIDYLTKKVFKINT
jgi:hypothetical protein